MSKSKTFKNVTPVIWECVKATSLKEHGTVYAPPGANSGTATTDTIVGVVLLNFIYNPDTNNVDYTIVKKPLLASENQIWDGIQSTINGCSSKGTAQK
jgi:hypothetical protein